MNKRHFCQLKDKELVTRRVPNINLCQLFIAYLREFTTISAHYPLTKYYFRSLKTIQDEKIKHTQGKHWFSIHPFSSFQYVRQFLMAIVYVLLVIWDQIDIAYLSKSTGFQHAPDTVMLVLNGLGLIDFILNFITGYMVYQEKINIHYSTGYYTTEETATVLNQKTIFIRYLKTFLIIDIFCLVNIIHLLTDLISRNKSFYYIYTCVRNIRVFRIFTAQRIGYIILTNVRIKQDLTIIVQCVFFYAFFSIFFGTLLIYVPEISSYIYDEDRRMYIQRLQEFYDNANEPLTTLDIFVQSTFDAFCLITVYRTKEMDKTVEIYCIVISATVVGIVLRIYVFISVYSIILRRYQSIVNHIIFMREVKNYTERLNLSKKLCVDIDSYFDAKMKHEYFQETEILNTLQKKMQYEIFSESSMGLIRNCNLFRHLPDYFIIQLSLRLKLETYIPGVTVITVGEIATCMYFIATGTVAVYSADGTELCHLSDGEYVGEIGILQSTARVADIVTIEHCELYRLDIKDFQEVIKPNSKFYKRIYKIAMKRMNVHVNLEEKK